PYRGQFNPLKEIDPDPDSPTAIDDAALLAEALLVDTGSGDKHWINGARELLKGLILFALLQEPEYRNLNTVRAFFRAEKGPRHALSLLTECGDAYDGLVAGIGHSFLSRDEKELFGIISTADVQLGFLDSKPLKSCLGGSSFKLDELKQANARVTVYLCLPA